MIKPSRIARHLLAAALSATSVTAAVAGDIERIRIPDPALQQTFVRASERSETFRSLVKRIEASNVIVIVDCQQLERTLLRGRTQLLAARPGVRYVAVGIDCLQPFAEVAAIVGHEFQHVVEIADGGVSDQASLARLYTRIGFTTCGIDRGRQFETDAARTAARQVRRELY